MLASDLAVLEGDGWFGGLEGRVRGALLREGRVRRLRGGEAVYGAGDAPNGLWAVLEGQVRLMGYAANGSELVALVVAPGAWFGELSSLDGGPRPHDAVAAGTCRLLQVPPQGVAAAARAEPLLYHALGLLVCAHQRAALAFIERSVGQSARARLAGVLASGAQGERGEVALRQEALAALVGVSRQTLNKYLRGFAREGLVAIGYGGVRVLDGRGLAGVADGG